MKLVCACRAMGVVTVCGLAVGLGGCTSGGVKMTGTEGARVAGPSGPRVEANVPPAEAGMGVIDLTEPGAVSFGSAPVEVIDTRTFVPQVQVLGGDGSRRIKDVVPAHQKPKRGTVGVANQLEAGGLMEAGRVKTGAMFPSIGQTPWTPPDPTLAVGPNHIVQTVNMDIAFYDKSGNLQFQSRLDNTGSPGFFEGVGAGNFTFDPKCFYDHYAGRFVVVALETYGSTQSWIDIAVSDDSDPNGTWYKYRTNSVVTVGTSKYWVDYPGFGYDGQAYYVTGNLFGLNVGGTAGTLFRVFNKTPLLSGGAAAFTDLRDGSVFSVQAAQHFGAAPPAPYFVTDESTTSMRVYAIRNPLSGSPTLTSQVVSVPSYSYPTSCAPNRGSGSADVLDGRVMNACWRNGKLVAGHGVSIGGRNQARWYEFNTGNWPTSGSVTLAQSGNINPGTGVHTWFPALYYNKHGDIGAVVARSTSSEYISAQVTGRKATDAAGTMGALEQIVIGSATVSGCGRWGDYLDIAVDPTDDQTFWVVGEYQDGGGWRTWVSSFFVTCPYDWNGDGEFNAFDYDDFVSDYFTYVLFGTGFPDFNGDGTVDAFDYDDFVSGYFSEGC